MEEQFSNGEMGWGWGVKLGVTVRIMGFDVAFMRSCCLSSFEKRRIKLKEDFIFYLFWLLEELILKY